MKVAFVIHAFNGEYLLDFDNEGKQIDHNDPKFALHKPAEHYGEMEEHTAIVKMDEYETQEQIEIERKRVAGRYSVLPEKVDVIKIID